MDSVSEKLIFIIITLVVVAGIYLLGESVLGVYVHIAAVVAFTVGLFFTIYY